MAPTIVLMNTDLFRDGLRTVYEWAIAFWASLSAPVQILFMLLFVFCVLFPLLCYLVRLLFDYSSDM